MKIGLFLGSVGSDSGGPERYDIELVKNLAAIDQDNEYRGLCLFEKGPERLVSQDNFDYRVLKPGARVASMLTSLPYEMSRYPAAVWHSTYVPPPFSPRDYLFTLVCSSMIEHPELYPPLIRYRLIALTNRAISKARHIICISDHIRQVVKERYGVSDDRLSMIHLGVSEIFKPLDKDECRRFVADTYGIHKPYFLFSGRWEPRKNVVRVIRAFARFKQETKSEIQLVFSGKKTWSASEADAEIDNNDLRSEIIDLGRSPNHELPQLYSGATALVYPSLWEGFGLPIVEGMASGTPVITSNNSSMAEIGADAALLVNPLDENEIAEAMHRISSDPALQAEMVDKGLRRAQLFTWRDTARKTLEIYQQLATDFKQVRTA